MKRIILLIPLILCACESSEEKKSKFVSYCVSHEFTENQCEVLYAIKKDSDDSAESSAALSGVAIGMSSMAGAYRR